MKPRSVTPGTVTPNHPGSISGTMAVHAVFDDPAKPANWPAFPTPYAVLKCGNRRSSAMGRSRRRLAQCSRRSSREEVGA